MVKNYLYSRRPITLMNKPTQINHPLVLNINSLIGQPTPSQHEVLDPYPVVIYILRKNYIHKFSHSLVLQSNSVL